MDIKHDINIISRILYQTAIWLKETHDKYSVIFTCLSNQKVLVKVNEV
jgi:hypothetical protein